ncbi:Hypothetical protein A7982_03347 [Minicystis rosea]|nr:Hypothetical protein A7982_03347 [Minicystis rosea]
MALPDDEELLVVALPDDEELLVVAPLDETEVVLVELDGPSPPAPPVPGRIGSTPDTQAAIATA